jgi:Flp pilus assembly pilin Flp
MNRMTYFRTFGTDVILCVLRPARRIGRSYRDRRGSPEMTELSVFKTWLIAKLGIKDERGANLVEYVFLLVFIALVVVIAVTALGGKVSQKFSTASSQLG